MTKILKKPDSPCIGKDVGKPESLYAAGANIKWYNHAQKQFGSFFKSYTCPHKDLYMNQVHVHSSTIHNSRKLDNPNVHQLVI